MKLRTSLIVSLAMTTAVLFQNVTDIQSAPPNYLNYQGRIKQGGKAITGDRFFEFKITNSDGSQVYWTSGSTKVWVAGGLFRYVLGPLDNVNFKDIEPYLEIKVGDTSPDTLMLPREKLVSSLYAIYSSSASYSYQTLNATFLSNRPYEAFVSTRAENQTIAGEKTFSGDIVFQSKVGIGINNPLGELHIRSGSSGTTSVHPYADDLIIESYSYPGMTILGNRNSQCQIFFADEDATIKGALVYAHSNDSLSLWSDASPRLTISSIGYVGIGTNNPGWLLHVQGAAAKPGGGSWTDTSDIRLKKNIRPISNPLKKILALRGVCFEWAEPAKSKLLPGEQMGMIAQDVEKVFPQWVEDNANGYKDLTFRGFEALVTESIRELKEQNEKLRKRIEKLESKLNNKH